MNEELERMLKARDKGIGETSGVLAKLWRQILLDRDVRHMQWANLMTRYLNDPRNGIARDVKDKSSARGNLNKELKRPRMTWKVFRKGLRFLGPTAADFTVRLRWPDGTTSEHRTVLENDNRLSELDVGDAEQIATRVLVLTSPTLPEEEFFKSELRRLLDNELAAQRPLQLVCQFPAPPSLATWTETVAAEKDLSVATVHPDDLLGYVNRAIVFWDGKDAETKALLDLIIQRKIKHWLVVYSGEK